MPKLARKGKGKMPAISTASLPDVIFMLLFFFMVSTQMKEVSYKVKISTPKATEVIKLKKSSAISYIYVGKPHKQFQRLYGTDSQIQLNDQFANIEDIRSYITSERESLNEVDQKMLTVSLKVDEGTKMGIVTDIKQELRKASALKINYSAKKDVKIQ